MPQIIMIKCMFIDCNRQKTPALLIALLKWSTKNKRTDGPGRRRTADHGSGRLNAIVGFNVLSFFVSFQSVTPRISSASMQH